MSDKAENHHSAPHARRLEEVIRGVKNAAADRDDVVVELREASRTRLDLMAAELAPLFAQDPRATITGQITDSSNALMPAVTVRATNLETNVTATAVSNAQGAYEIPYLNPGAYKLEAEIAGFKTWSQSGVELRMGDRIRLDADPVGGTLVFTGEDGAAVVADTGRRDARTVEQEPAAVGGRSSIFDLPTPDGGDGNDRLN